MTNQKSTPENNKTQTIKKNNFIELEFTARIKGGDVFDTNIESEAKKLNSKMKPKPLIISVGHNMLIKGLDKELEGEHVLILLVELREQFTFQTHVVLVVLFLLVDHSEDVILVVLDRFVVVVPNHVQELPWFALDKVFFPLEGDECIYPKCETYHVFGLERGHPFIEVQEGGPLEDVALEVKRKDVHFCRCPSLGTKRP